MIKQDDRTPEQRNTHRWAVIARDTFMSGWGCADGGTSRCAWTVPDAIAQSDLFGVLVRWVKGRSDMRGVNTVLIDRYRAPRGTAHLHIYTVEASHPCFTREEGERFAALVKGE